MLPLLALLPLALGDGPDVDYARDVEPILDARCFRCHGPKRQRGGLRLDRPDGALLGGDSGRPAVVPGDADGSYLLTLVSGGDGELVMPPKGAPLESEEIEVLRAWITAGADYGAAAESENEAAQHWAYTTPERPPVPDVVASWPRNAIDHFVFARLEAEGVAPSPEAGRATLLRRASLDLTGLPPTRDELRAFLDDPAPGAYERAVDRLLASPHYGEHFGRHWLDLARYADSHGYTIDGGRSMWRWRDWVVDALNADMPFDAFTVRQLAGDLLPEATDEDVLATAFHRNTMINQEGGADDEEFRVAAVIDRVNTTGAVWLGTTLDCAQCHTHKYDPFTQRDYYGLYAFFDHTEDGGVRAGPSAAVPTAEQRVEIGRVEASLARLRGELDALALDDGRWQPLEPLAFHAESGVGAELSPDGVVAIAPSDAPADRYTVAASVPFPATGVRIEVLPDDRAPERGPGRADNGNFVLNEVRVLLRDEPVEVVRATADHFQHRSKTSHWPPEHAVDRDPKTGWAILEQVGVAHELVLELERPVEGVLRLELDQTYGARHTLGRIRLWATDAPPPVEVFAEEERDLRELVAAAEADLPKPPSTLVLRERGAPRDTRMLLRGNFLTPGPPVEPSVPAILPPLGPVQGRATRLDLARWLVREDHPLTWRVAANRAWQRFFGRGIVATENDFGTRGEPPTHPALLDWLACELREHRSLKRLHRAIVTSATYRQSSVARPELLARDPSNWWLARQHRLRLDAEAIRDSALVASGRLSRQLGGPPVHPPQPAGVFAFTQNKKPWPTSDGDARYRRTLYTQLWRSSPYPFLTTFDLADRSVTCTRRNRSNTPLQALTMANDPMILELAAAMGARAAAAGGTDEERAAALFRDALVRAPSERELGVVLAQLDGGDPEAWARLARVLLNTDEFVTRE